MKKIFIFMTFALAVSCYSDGVKYQRILFRLNLSDWSYQKLVDFSNEFAGTGGADYFGVRIFPAEYVRNFYKAPSGREFSQKFGVELSFVVADDSYFPEKWPRRPLGRDKAIKKLEEVLAQGKPVFVPLCFHGDEVSLRVPVGLYFLNYVVELKHPSRFNHQKRWGKTTYLDKKSYGPYCVMVKPFEPVAVTYTPKPMEIEYDKLEKYFESLRKLGAKEMIENYK